MKPRYYVNKAGIIYWVKKGRKFLGIKDFVLTIEMVEHTTNKTPFYFRFEGDKCFVTVGQVRSNLILGSYTDCLKGLKPVEFILMSIFHELAHCWQYKKHQKWFKKYSSNYLHVGSNGYYAQKIEQNANKVARIMLDALKDN